MTDIASVLTRNIQDTPSAQAPSKHGGDGDQDQFSQALNAAGGSAQKQSGKDSGKDDTDTTATKATTDADDDKQQAPQDKSATAGSALASAYRKLAALAQGQVAPAAAANDATTQAAGMDTTATADTVTVDTDDTAAQAALADAAGKAAAEAETPLAALLALKAAVQGSAATTNAKDKDEDETDAAADGATDRATSGDAAADASAGLKAADLLQMLAAGPLAAVAAASQQAIPVKTAETGKTAGNSGTAVADIAGLMTANADTSAADSAFGIDDTAQATDVTDDTQVFRLQKIGAVAQSVDIALKSDADGKADVSTDATTQVTPDTVNILDSRRFLGLAQTGNTGMLVAAMTGDKDWAGAMSASASINLLDDGLAPTSNVVHTLKLQLNPDNLGTVTASMRLVGDELSIHLTVHNSAAYRELTSGSSSLVDGLRSQGFSVDNITVSIASSSDGTSSNSNNNSGAQSGSGQQSSTQTGQQGQQQQNQQAWQRGAGDGTGGQQQGRWSNSNGSSQTEGRNEGVGEAVAGSSTASGSVYL
jgi:chemotaxis protein MotD